ncbi:hypothetical protein [Streptomyces decoyicus]|uniref:hypothetical protein n=1 Tax=Streptomyces decoyicus TaxID=249567 RepID=UPI002E19BB0F|nr:hypothetical protein OG532_01310 [Streptomyces decoyicus]
MENLNTTSDAGSDIPDGSGDRPRRTAADWGWLTVLALGVLIVGFFEAVLGPLFAIACDACQDGVRSPHLFPLLIAVAWYGVPLTAIGTVVGIYLPRGGGRAGAIGLGVLAALMFVMMLVGRLA